MPVSQRQKKTWLQAHLHAYQHCCLAAPLPHSVLHTQQQHLWMKGLYHPLSVLRQHCLWRSLG